jgi:redox-sensitive bicupin YhaK (pirin superfamily)
MQTWLALPDGGEEVGPAFDHIVSDGLPLVEDGGARARVLMGTLWGATAATPQHSPTIYADIELAQAGSLVAARLMPMRPAGQFVHHDAYRGSAAG